MPHLPGNNPDTNAPIKSTVLKDYIHPLCQSVLDGVISQDAFWQQISDSATPLVEDDPEHSDCKLVTFVFRNDAANGHVSVESRFGQPIDQKLQRIEGTDIMYLGYRFESDTRLCYAFAENMPLVNMDTASLQERKALLEFIRNVQLIPDPFNPQQFRSSGEHGNDDIRSVLALENSLSDDYAIKRDDIERGWLHEEQFTSDILGNKRRIWVYTPAEYDRSAADYPVLLLLDGGGQIGVARTHRILDNLIADKKIPPLIAVFIDNAPAPARNIELPCYDDFAAFIENELIPWLYHHFPVRSLPTDWYVTGVSYGGLASLWLGFRISTQIGNVISQSGSFWWGRGFPISEEANPVTSEYERQSFIKDISEASRRPLRIWLEVGRLEPPIMMKSNRALRDVLREKNYDMIYHEFSGTHHFSHWQTSLPLALIHMMGG